MLWILWVAVFVVVQAREEVNLRASLHIGAPVKLWDTLGMLVRGAQVGVCTLSMCTQRMYAAYTAHVYVYVYVSVIMSCPDAFSCHWYVPLSLSTRRCQRPA